MLYHCWQAEPADKNMIHLLNQRIIVMAPIMLAKPLQCVHVNICVCVCVRAHGPIKCVCTLNKACNCAGSFAGSERGGR